MHLSPDQIIYWQYGDIKLNATIVMTWVVMASLVLIAWLLGRQVRKPASASQIMLTGLVTLIREQLTNMGLSRVDCYLPFLATLFLFIAMANLWTIMPFYEPPTGSLSTTAALALLVFVAVPWFGIRQQGVWNYLKEYTHPTLWMLPFHIIGELSRTLALAVRLFGNMMSGSMIIAILLTVTPLLFPVIMSLLGLLTGMVQAYIFTVLASVYITAATTSTDE